MKSQVFRSVDSAYIISFLAAFKLACGEFWCTHWHCPMVFIHFVKHRFVAVFNAHIARESILQKPQEEKTFIFSVCVTNILHRCTLQTGKVLRPTPVWCPLLNFYTIVLPNTERKRGTELHNKTGWKLNTSETAFLWNETRCSSAVSHVYSRARKMNMSDCDQTQHATLLTKLKHGSCLINAPYNDKRLHDWQGNSRGSGGNVTCRV